MCNHKIHINIICCLGNITARREIGQCCENNLSDVGYMKFNAPPPPDRIGLMMY